MKKRFIVLAVLSPVILLLGAISLLPSPETTSQAKSAIPEKPVPLTKAEKQKPVGPWLITLTKVASHGQKTQAWLDDSKTLEANGQWVTAHIQVENTSQSRQSLKELFQWTGATILDEKGGEKEADSDTTDLTKMLEFEEKPFASGEVRTIKISFDIPEDIGVQRIDLGSNKSLAKIKVLPQ